MEIAGFAVAVLAALIAGLSAVAAFVANRHANLANARARDALDLQSTIDARAREFRDVHWQSGWSMWTKDDALPEYELRNAGLTTAVGVTLVLDLPSGAQVFELGLIDPGETKTVTIEFDQNGPGGLHFDLVRRTGVRVHWSSPLGHPENVRYPPA